MADIKYSVASKVMRFAARYVEIIKDLNTSKDFIYYGNDNLLPNKLVRYINNSGTSKKCVEKVVQYIEADGFVDKKTATSAFNDYQKGDDLLSDIGQQVGYFRGFALHVKRKTTGEVGGIEVLPFQKVRKSKKGGYWYNSTLGTTKYKESEWKWFPEFKGEKVDVNFLNSNKQGEIFYAFKRSAENSYYPIPDYYAGIEDVITSAELSKMDLELAWNGFMTSGILTFIGDPNQTVENENNKTVRELYEEQMREFTGGVKDVDGMSGRMSLFVNWVARREEAPVLQTFDAKSIIDASNSKRDAINRDVCRLFGVHPVLIGFSEATVLGNQQALANAQKQLIDVVNPMQRFIESSLKKIYPLMDFSISQVNTVAVADGALLGSLSEEEKRNMFFGLEPLVRAVPNEGERILEVLNGLSPLLATKVIDLIPQETLLKALGINSQTTLPSGEPN